MACKPSTVCTLTRYRMSVAQPWRGVAVSATREHTRAHESTVTHTKLTFTIQTQLIKPTATSSETTFETNSYQHMTFLVLIVVTNKTVHLECNNV